MPRHYRCWTKGSTRRARGETKPKSHIMSTLISVWIWIKKLQNILCPKILGYKNEIQKPQNEVVLRMYSTGTCSTAALGVQRATGWGLRAEWVPAGLWGSGLGGRRQACPRSPPSEAGGVTARPSCTWSCSAQVSPRCSVASAFPLYRGQVVLFGLNVLLGVCLSKETAGAQRGPGARAGAAGS